MVIETTEYVNFLNSSLPEVYENKVWKKTGLRNIFLDENEGIDSTYEENPFLEPVFSHFLLELYIRLRSYPQDTVQESVLETITTLGRAIRNIVLNSANIVEIRSISQIMQEYGVSLIPYNFSKDVRKIMYLKMGILFTWKGSDSPSKEEIQNVEFRQNVNSLGDILKNTYFGDILSLTFDKNDLHSLLEKESSKVLLEFNRELLKYVTVTFHSFLNVSPEMLFQYLNYRLLNDHIFRDMYYSLFMRAIFGEVAHYTDVDTSFGNFMNPWILDSFKVDDPKFQGISGNFRVFDEIFDNWWIEDLRLKGMKRFQFIMKVLNVGIRSEEILHLWRESREDIGLESMDSILFIPTYSNPNLMGAYQKFRLERHLLKNEGQIILLTLPFLHESVKFLSYYPEEKKSERVENLYEMMGRYFVGVML